MAMVGGHGIPYFDVDVKFILTSTSVSLISPVGCSGVELPRLLGVELLRCLFRKPHMSEQRAEIGTLPAVPFMKVPAEGGPYLEGSLCKRCNAVFLGQRAVCSKCGARDQLETKRLSNRGTLYTYSI